MPKPFEIGGEKIEPGERRTVDLRLPDLFIGLPLSLRAHVVNGRRPGPRLFVSAAVHGDELNGIEIVRRLLRRSALRRLRGTLIAVPVVNVYGVLNYSRYLPDRRDLNRSFPGHERGSLTSRVADAFMSQVVAQCTHGIDLHTAAVHRTNLPQIRAHLDDAETAGMARAFGVPVLLNSAMRDGSLRQAAADSGVRVLLYEGGEALRFDELAIRAGLHGVLHVMQHLEMLRISRPIRVPDPKIARSSSWIRATASGLLDAEVKLGQRVESGDILARIGDPFGEGATKVSAEFSGIVIGHTRLPLVHEGEALFHVARFDDHGDAADRVEAFRDVHEDTEPPPPYSPET